MFVVIVFDEELVDRVIGPFPSRKAAKKYAFDNFLEESFEIEEAVAPRD